MAQEGEVDKTGGGKSVLAFSLHSEHGPEGVSASSVLLIQTQPIGSIHVNPHLPPPPDHPPGRSSSSPSGRFH